VNPVSVYVPDLISRQKHDEMIAQYREEITALQRGLPEPERVRDYDRRDDEDDEES